MTTAFETYELGSTPLKNRIAMAPMTRSRATAPHGTATELMATFDVAASELQSANLLAVRAVAKRGSARIPAYLAPSDPNLDVISATGRPTGGGNLGRVSALECSYDQGWERDDLRERHGPFGVLLHRGPWS
jgi:hypothetical protein